MRTAAVAVAAIAALVALPATCSIVNVPSSCSGAGTCTSLMNAALSSCASATTPCTVQLDPASVYQLASNDGNGCPLRATPGSQPITLDGQGSEILLENLTGFLCVQGGAGVSVVNMTIDMVRQPYSYGQVVASSRSSSVVRVSLADYPAPPVSNPAYWMNQVQAILQYDPVAQRPAVGAVDIYSLDPGIPCTWALNGDGTANITVAKGSLPPQSWMILRHWVYSLNGLSFTSSTDILVQDVTLFSVPGMGVVADSSTGVTLRRFQVLKRSGRPMSITADGSHFTSCRGGDVHIDSCVFEGQGDDGGNIPARFWEIHTLSADRLTAEVYQRGQPTPFNGQVGDALLFYNRSTFAAYGQGGAVQVASVSGTSLQFSAPLPAEGGVWDLIVNLADEPRSVSIVNTVYRNNRARGQLLKASNSLVHNCSFIGNTGPAIQVYPDGVYWFEGDVISRGNWTIENTLIQGVNYGPAQMPGDIFMAAQVPTWQNGAPTTNGGPAMQGQQSFNVTVRNVTFVQSQPSAAVAVYGVNGLTLEDNTVLFDAQSPPSANFFAHNSINVVASGNTCSPGPGGLRAGACSGP